jgi:hypothetical protein
VSNPTTVTFSYAYWATAARFEGAYFAVPLVGGSCPASGAASGDPVTIDDLGNPLTGLSGSTLLKARPLGCYVYRVRAYDQTGLVSLWGAPSNVFAIKEP